MRNRIAAHRYALALARSIDDQNRIENILHSLEAFAETLTSHPDLQYALRNPAIPIGVRTRTLERVLIETDLDPEPRRLIVLLHRRGRLGQLPEVVAAFRHAADERLDRTAATVTTARPLTPALQSRVRESLERLTGKTVNIRWEIDPAILGGLQARIGDKVFDGSIRARMRQLRERLLAQEM